MNDGFSGFIFREPSTAAIHIALLPRSFRSTFVVPAVAETEVINKRPEDPAAIKVV